jgi:hypothetical protein
MNKARWRRRGGERKRELIEWCTRPF